MASIATHKLGFRVQVYVKGERDSAIFRTKREAIAWGSARETELRELALKPAADKNTLKYVLERYRDEVSINKRGYQWEELRLNAYIRDANLPINKPLSSCTPDVIGLWRDTRLKVVSNSTVLRELGLLSSVLETARREWRLIDHNPVKDVRKPRESEHRRVVITLSQTKCMLKALHYNRKGAVKTINQAVGLAFLFALRTGMRSGEICGLTWGNVRNGYCILPLTKSTPREVPLSLKAERIINRMKGFDDDLVFGLNAQTRDALFRKARDKAELSGFTFHDARHTAATNMIKNTKINVLQLCKIMGWSDPKEAMIYYNPSAKDLKSILDSTT